MDSWKQIARIETDFPTKFGIPRQSSLVKGLRGKVIFEPEYRNQDAVRGLEEFSHIWLLWGFSEAKREHWTPTVRPPRLGGNTRMGVFATRSPFRPNPIGLSSVRLDDIRIEKEWGPVLYVSGIDMMDQTPIYDIKPYLPQVDSHPQATAGFSGSVSGYHLEVIIPDIWKAKIPSQYLETVQEILAQDPRPSYQNDPERIYGMSFGGMDIQFTVCRGVLTVCGVITKGCN